LLGLQR